MEGLTTGSLVFSSGTGKSQGNVVPKRLASFKGEHGLCETVG